METTVLVMLNTCVWASSYFDLSEKKRCAWIQF